MSENLPSTTSRVERYLYYDRVNRPYIEWQVDQFRDRVGRRVLEVGCGVGGILEQIGKESVELVHGIDLDTEIVEAVREKYRDRPEYSFSAEDLGAASAARLEELREKRFDTVLCVNVLEHIEDDYGFAARLASLVVPGGRLILLVPAHPALYGKYDALDGHFRRYGKRRLREVVARCDLELESIRHFNAIGAAGWWIVYRLLRRGVHGEGQFGVMNRLVPLMRPVESAVPPPFGLSLIAVGRKASAG